MPRFLVVLDVDSTLIEQEIIELLAEESGSGAEVASITLDAMNGKLDFEESLRARVATLKGLSISVFARVRRSIAVTKGVPELVRSVQAAGGRVGAISGGFHEVIDPLAAGLGLDRWRANTLEVEDGILTGRVRGRIIDAKAKAETLESWSRIYSIPLENAVSIGDGANDLEMMRLAGLSVAFEAKAPVRDQAGVILDDRDLSRVLPLLGLEG
ncbi:MAG: phosphoserine phosphatase SerB [Cryobacterium sp.]|nr:phosphoserine phosphatase SerB [Cryobacterium sp.]MCC7128479.1 phosphoserine phosphatase SerB [Microbacteriaceae bacterium]MCO5293991.1 phosphoserine phosphatase SerB [Homoserinimonas sp.]MBX3090599.1 phosphoserine phosphatase SerB [Cryobacterium sp.]MBX3116262.1 phosphoserine phosphatase SerB [Cryobacterium sp.]